MKILLHYIEICLVEEALDKSTTNTILYDDYSLDTTRILQGLQISVAVRISSFRTGPLFSGSLFQLLSCELHAQEEKKLNVMKETRSCMSK